jgi:hypothetical protein
MRVEQSCSPVRKYEVGNEADVIRVPYAVSAARPYRRPYSDRHKAHHPRKSNRGGAPGDLSECSGFRGILYYGFHIIERIRLRLEKIALELEGGLPHVSGRAKKPFQCLIKF